MRRRLWYRGLALFALVTSGTMALLAIIALGLSQALAAGAATLCAIVFFVPGLYFLNHARRLLLKDVALAHAGRFAESRGVIDAEALGKELGVPAADAAKILLKAIREGYAKGEMSEAGSFVAASAPRCASCGAPVSREPQPEKCPSCGAAFPARE
ncbi:MAG TPA: hypothetical protein VIB49_00425 [Thermoplasmata archaeon]